MSQVQLNEIESHREGDRAPLISISNMKAYFKQTKGTLRRRTTLIKAVDDVSFDVRNSEVLSLVGESGSGKTTIARCVAALSKPTSGSIKFNGTEVTTLKGKGLTSYRRDVQIIFQDPFESLYSRFDVFTAISTPLIELTGVKDHSKLEEMVGGLLMEVGLNPIDYMHRLPHQLSGGERQRISIARALAPSPKLLVADEPITMLDASQRLNVLSILMQLKERRNLTVLLITHDLASAKLVSNRTAVLYRGRLVELGRTLDILSRPQHPYTELILQATPDVEGDIPSFGNLGGIEESEVVKQGCIFRPRCKYATQVCSEVDPPLIERSMGRLVACHNALNQTREV
ncbi:MAG: oligopeptide/dipeptide ABC transporter ATP-binding protein [Nitrososphaerales archaeon]